MNSRSGCLILAAAWLSAGAAGAAPVTISQPFMNLENRGINSLGFTPGEFMRVGATSVIPNGSAGTSGVASTVNLVTGAIETRSLVFNPAPVIPNFFVRNLPDSPALYGPWTLNFSNGADTRQSTVTLPAGTTQAPFVNTITLSGTSAVPVFTWAPPPGALVNAYRINIYDRSLVTATSSGQVSSRTVAPSQTSYTVDGADFTVPGYAFQLGRNYSIEIGLIRTKDGGSTDFGNSDIAAISRVYADFRASDSGGPVVNLPVTRVDGSFQFNFAVTPGQTYFIDPVVAVGYDYRIGAGNPSFASVVLPAGIGDGRYDIFGLGAGGGATLLADDWAGGSVFSFAGAGVDAFRVTGIEASAALDPADVTAFVTGLTFSGSGLFTGTQTPITLDVAAVPEPETYALMLLGLGCVGWRLRRRASPLPTR